MTGGDIYDDEEDDEEDKIPFDFSKFFQDPQKFLNNKDLNKVFKSKEFQNIFQDIFKQISKNLPKDFRNLSPEDFAKEFMKNKDKFGFKGPIMYGFNINFGPDGKPIIDSFGNIKRTPYSDKPKVRKAREPLVEVSEGEDQITVIAEMPGVTREDIELKATTHSITISTKEAASPRKYYKEIDLPAAINSEYAKARYQNGILEIKLKKVDEQHKKIKVD